jgi:sodium transport system permease protein
MSGPPERLAAALAIARRDLLEFVRDRRTLFITLLLPVATYPILALATALGLRTATSEMEAQQAPQPIMLAISGPEAVPFTRRLAGVAALPDAERPGWPADIGAEIANDAEARRLVDEGEADLWVVAPAGLLATLDGRGTATLDVQAAGGHAPSARLREQFDAVMDTLAADARRRRIESIGLPASLLEPLHVRYPESQSTVAPRGILATLAGAVLVLLAVLTMTGAFYPAIDAIAGEKERGTIETLLIAPCTTADLVLGKFLAVFAVTLATLAANVVSIVATGLVAARLLPQGLTMSFAGGIAAPLVVVVLAFTALAALSAATSLAVTTASRSMKEAQNTLTPVILLVSALAGTALVPGVESGTLVPAAPFVGQVLVARSAIGTAETEPLRLATIAGPLALSLVSAAILTWLLLALTAVLVTDEEVLFRGPDAGPRGLLRRPAPRPQPTAAQGLVAVVAGLTALWYGQAISGAAADLSGRFAEALVSQQAIAVLVPLLGLSLWQRVDPRETFFLRWPAGGGLAGVVATLAAAAIGAALFAAGAWALLTFRGDAMSPAIRRLSEQLLELLLGQPWWMSLLLIAVMPAICEEFLFRGWLLSALAGPAATGSAGGWRGVFTAGGAANRAVAAVVVQAACFAAFHLLPERMPQTFVLGLVLGVFTLATRSILPAVVGHLAHNAMPLVMLRLWGELP